MKWKIIILVAIMLLLSTDLLASGWNDFDVPLSGGYHLVRTNADSIMIFHQEYGFVIPPKITGIGVKENLIYGLCEKVKDADMACAPGYFLLDTKNNFVRTELSKENWLAKLSRYHIKNEPELKIPKRYWYVFAISRRYIMLPVIMCVVAVAVIADFRLRQRRVRCRTQPHV